VLEALVLLATAALDGYIREAALRQEIAKLKIEIDESRRADRWRKSPNPSSFKICGIKPRKCAAGKRNKAAQWGYFEIFQNCRYSNIPDKPFWAYINH
jgi:hypothetical protein